ncbi:unnamed protein product, partial [Cylicostephanus goldi]
MLLVKECEEKTKELEQLNSSFATSRKEFESLQQELASTKAELAAANERLAEAAEAKRAKVTLSRIREEKAVADEKFQKAIAEKAAIEKQLQENDSKKNETLAALQNVTHLLTSAMYDLEDFLLQAKNTLAIFENEKALLRSEVDQLKVQLETMELKHSEEISGNQK